jgi:glycosyltransferase involved in cell wall biosynthesis
MQVVESMACGTPVVCSDRGALPEVTAGAALLADPSDPEALAAQLIAVLTDPAKSEELAELGSRRARQFSWRRTAEVVHQGLRQAARGR